MSLTSRLTQPSKVFISYSHKDQGLRDQLETHLSLLKRQGFISSWHDRKIGAGEEWEEQIDSYLNKAHIILLLISPDFMASDYCFDIEMTLAMTRHEAGEACVIPIILRPVDWNSAPFGKLQALPQDAKPITTWQNHDEAFLEVARGMRKIVEEQGAKINMVRAYHSPTHRSILGFPPPTNPKTIQQRSVIVKDVYAKLAQPDSAAIVLTGIGGVGKSTIAALVYRYAEEQRQAGHGSFLAEALWLTIDPAVTLLDLAESVFETLQKPFLEFASLPPQNQAVALHKALNSVDKPRLIILDQFENFLDWQTGQALVEKPGVGEWLDAINSQPSTCRVLLTSRLWPQGAHNYSPTCMQEYHINGLTSTEGVSLLYQQGVEVTQGTDAEMQKAVALCEGHALSLTLLASILRRNGSLSLPLLFQDPAYASLWMGNIAHSLLDYIYTRQLSEAQCKVLQAFSIYREPVPVDAVQAIIPEVPKAQILSALNVLLYQHLLNAVGGGCYQLHSIVASYAQAHLTEDGEEVNSQALRAAHAKAGQYYLQQDAVDHSPLIQRRRISDLQELIEAIWHLCLAGQWHEAYDLMHRTNIFTILGRLGGDVVLLELYQLLLPLDRWRPERLPWARIYLNLGRTYNRLEQRDQALQYLEQALSIFRELGAQSWEGVALDDLGSVYQVLGKEKQARECYEKALSIFRETRYRAGEATALNKLGSFYADLGQREQAQEYSEQALSIYRKIGKRGGEGWALYNIGKAYANIGQVTQALEYYKQVLRIRREIKNRGREAEILNDIGLLYLNEHLYDVALACFILAHQIFEYMQNPNVTKIQKSIDAIQKEVGKGQFQILLTQVEPHASEIVEKAMLNF